ncbi:DISARM system phospholipase D-like protein DrmC [Ruegeria faecimaris]|uniref:DISARM system phospholipase D-like protein DrmC n=1 Tax=Ruegeria faecimaris TaxID=686389 RepID=UPI00248FE20A|nr:DISARM system phospholipase D-like protein DrmC [Ruegeria faecimaris]
MRVLLDRAYDLATLLPPSRIAAIARKMEQLENSTNTDHVLSSVTSGRARDTLDGFLKAWNQGSLSGREAGYLLLASSHSLKKANEENQTELVLTGPTTPYVATRRTERVLLDVIANAQTEIFIVSFVAHERPSLLNALTQASDKGVLVNIILESSVDSGGTLKGDQFNGLKKALPDASFYHWTKRLGEFVGGKVHAKIVVADKKTAFLTSANLTGHAMERNIEAGALFRGGDTPRDLVQHLRGLIDLKILTRLDD